MSRAVLRVVVLLTLLVAGVLSLPLAAYLLDDRGLEDWIIPVQLLGMAAIGCGLNLAVPALVGDSSFTARRALAGAVLGLMAASVGVLVFWLLISGISGA